MQVKINRFSERSKIPNIAGAVDGSHVPIKFPKTNHKDYFNRKHFYSYVLQGIVDSTGLSLCFNWFVKFCLVRGSRHMKALVDYLAVGRACLTG